MGQALANRRSASIELFCFLDDCSKSQQTSPTLSTDTRTDAADYFLFLPFSRSTLHLGNAIKVCRAHRGLTQARLAKQAGISLSYLSLLENDKRDANISTLESIAQGLKIPLNLLFFLASDGQELQGLPEGVRDKLSSVILRLLNEPKTAKT